MSISPAAVSLPGRSISSRERFHRIQVRLAVFLSATFIVALSIYGAGYYWLPEELRPFSPKYELLRPSGAIGINLGVLGVALFCIIFLYALRKVVPWLGRIGTARHWMDFHAVAGVTAPIVIAFHASFKFRGLAGIAFWIMLAVALSGLVGRYLYGQIPRSLSAAELSLQELKQGEDDLAAALLGQAVFSERQLARVLDMPSPEHTRNEPVLLALLEMMAFDIIRPWRIASLRRAALTSWGVVRSFGGLLRTDRPDIENVVQIVRQKAALSKRIVFLDHTRRVFHLWHVIHRPFSYSFAVLAIIHIVVVTTFGFL